MGGTCCQATSRNTCGDHGVHRGWQSAYRLLRSAPIPLTIKEVARATHLHESHTVFGKVIQCPEVSIRFVILMQSAGEMSCCSMPLRKLRTFATHTHKPSALKGYCRAGTGRWYNADDAARIPARARFSGRAARQWGKYVAGLLACSNRNRKKISAVRGWQGMLGDRVRIDGRARVSGVAGIGDPHAVGMAENKGNIRVFGCAVFTGKAIITTTYGFRWMSRTDW